MPRPPRSAGRGCAARRCGAPGRRVDLKEIVTEKLTARPLDADVDRARLIELAGVYLDEAARLAG